jgi:predicted glycogen debranching enzyme
MMAVDRREWLEPDGLGGFASGTASGIRTRRYHALLLDATTPPTGRMVLVNGFDAFVVTDSGRFALSSQRYTPDVIHPDGVTHIEEFSNDPWPRWTWRLPDGTLVEQELFVVHGRPLTIASWRLVEGGSRAQLEVRPFVSGRDYHATHHENGAIDMRASADADGILTWRLYDGVPAILSSCNGSYIPDPQWYRNFLYTAELDRGLDATEDLATPGTLVFDLAASDAYWVLSTENAPAPESLDAAVARYRRNERDRRAAFATSLEGAAGAFIVNRGSGSTIVAGYPWFTDWGRDTFISLPGLCLSTGRFEIAEDILVEWAGTVSEGMLPNRFADAGETPEFNAVDASLWFVIAVQLYLDEAERAGRSISRERRDRLDSAVLQIVEGYGAGTRHGIHADDDGLLAAGAPGLQLTWMDARVDGRVITPRIGKPVEVQALWINALAIAARRDPRWTARQRAAELAFGARFWNESRGYLYDVVDVDHRRGAVDPTLRPNQVFAVGGLPLALVTGDRARRVVDTLERELLVPGALRTLGPGEPGYTGRYEGGPAMRDAAYHQGTAWPWLTAAFGDAILRTRPPARARRDLARLIESLEAHLTEAGLGHVSEVIAGDPPHAPAGCPFQAWSLAALIRLRDMAGASVAHVSSITRAQE